MVTYQQIKTTKPGDITFDPTYRSRWLKLTEAQQYRILEIIPGLLVWATFALAVFLSLVKPLWAIYFIIVFDLFWFVRILYLLLHMLVSWRRFRKNIKTDWYSKLKKEHPEYVDYLHLIFYPTAGEPLVVLDKSFNSIKESNYDTKKLLVVLAGEERDRENFLQIAENLKAKYQDYFYDILVTVHPAFVPGELQGKGANIHYAGRRAQEYIDKLKFDYDKIIVSSFDCDTLPHRQYFAYLTHTFINHPRPTRASYQPIAIYNNNIWESNFLIRTVMNSTTFWLLTDLARPERLFTFSSHSMSFTALQYVGFWQKEIVTEDSRIFLQCFCHYNGDYEVVPLYIPVYMDTVWTGKFWQAMRAQYKQMRRWAWGVENFPYQAWFYLKIKNLPVKKGLHYLWNQLEGVYSWATAPLLILVLGRLPLWLMDKDEKVNVIAQNAPIMLEWIMTAAMVGLVFSAILSTILMPPRPHQIPAWHWAIIPLQWVIFPLVMIIFGSIPAVDALTRLLLGNYLGFNVTPKSESHRAITGNE